MLGLALVLDRLSEMAEQLGESEDVAVYQDQAASLRKKIRELMWNEEDGFYYDLDGLSHEQIKVKTPHAFSVLMMPGLPRRT